MKILEERLNDQLSKKDVEIKQLQNKIEALEQQTVQQEIQIKDLKAFYISAPLIKPY